MTNPSICVIGAGFHATTNIYPALVETGATITAVATRNLDRSEQTLLRFGSTVRVLCRDSCSDVWFNW